jgi:hypothetical protein
MAKKKKTSNKKKRKLFVDCLVKSLQTEDDKWVYDAGAYGNGKVSVYIHVRRLRFLDSMAVTVEYIDVWLTLSQRLRVRRATRNMLVRKASAKLGCSS